MWGARNNIFQIVRLIVTTLKERIMRFDIHSLALIHQEDVWLTGNLQREYFPEGK